MIEVHLIAAEPEGRLRITALGAPGVTFVSAASSDPVERQAIGAATASAEGLLAFADGQAAEVGHRFDGWRGP